MCVFKFLKKRVTCMSGLSSFEGKSVKGTKEPGEG